MYTIWALATGVATGMIDGIAPPDAPPPDADPRLEAAFAALPPEDRAVIWSSLAGDGDAGAAGSLDRARRRLLEVYVALDDGAPTTSATTPGTDPVS